MSSEQKQSHCLSTVVQKLKKKFILETVNGSESVKVIKKILESYFLRGINMSPNAEV